MKWIINKIGLVGIVMIITFICLFTWTEIRQNKLTNNPTYTYGISLGISKSVRGSEYLYYEFKVNGIIFTSHMPTTFCNKCDCCKKGNKVIVKYQKDDPDNNGLIKELPANAILQDEQ